VASNLSLSNPNRDSCVQEGNRIKQGLQELAARIVEQDQDRFSARLKQFNQRFEEEKQRLESRAQPNNLRAPITPRFQNSKGREGSDNDG
jgi:hypothetical protein